MSGIGGEVWVVWNPAALIGIWRVPHREALRLVCAESEEDGPCIGDNGIAYEYASI